MPGVSATSQYTVILKRAEEGGNLGEKTREHKAKILLVQQVKSRNAGKRLKATSQAFCLTPLRHCYASATLCLLS